MATQHTGPLLPADIAEALKGYDAGDFAKASILATPRSIEPSTEIIQLSDNSPPLWNIDLTRDDLPLLSFPEDGKGSTLFAELAKRADRLICERLLGSEIAQPFDSCQVSGSCLVAMTNIEVAKKRMMADWQRFASNYAIPSLFILATPARPKWGQPGRGRKRKARFAARKLEAAKRELAREVKRMFPGTFTTPLVGYISERRQGACPADIFIAEITRWLRLDILSHTGPRR